VSRLFRLSAFDYLCLLLYFGMAVWGVAAQVEPPNTLIGASGEVLTRCVTLGVLAFGVLAIVGLLLDQASSDRTAWHAEWELPAVAALAGSWGTYSGVVWLLYAGRGNPDSPPTLAVFCILTTVMLVPFLVRLVVLIKDMVKTIRDARKAREWGLVDDHGESLIAT
jgi:hypothetical protein